MRHWITVIVLAATMAFAPVYAGTISKDDMDLTGLSEIDKATVIQQIEKLKEAKVAKPVVSAEEAKEWVSFGTEIGRGLADTAKELGVAANDLLTTPVGMLTAGLIVWHIAGNDLVGVVFGVMWLICFSIVWVTMYRRFMYRTTVQHFDKGEGPGGAKKVVTKDRIQLTKDSDGWMFACYVVSLAFGVLIGITSIF
jgi:hypothetical protein